jgi:signal transduction histidine kinase
MKKKFKREGILFPAKITLLVLIVWVVGMLVGVWITDIVNNYIIAPGEVRNFFIVLVFILISACVAFLIAFFITNSRAKMVVAFTECIDKIAEGDFSTQIQPIGKNNYMNAVIVNFNNMVKQLDSITLLRNDFISSFSHEFKTPIVSIKGYAELIKVSGVLRQEQKEYINIIIEESKRLTQLSDNTMLLLKLDSQTLFIDKKKFSVNGQIENSILLFDSLLKEKNIEIETNLSRVYIESSPDFIKEIWINLLSNAIKYTNNGGKIKVTCSSRLDNVIVTVEDNGIGMDEITKQKAFNKFYQQDNKQGQGLGLGLTIVKRIVDIANGEITIDSEFGKGTKITVTLPKE